jgi:hypothetical protein
MRSNYDDLMGLDMYDEGGMGEFVNGEMLKEAFIAAGASAGAIVVATWVLPKVANMDFFKSYEPKNRSKIMGALGLLGGLLGGRALWNYNRDAAMAVIGGVGGLGLAQLIDSFLDMDLLHGAPLGDMPSEDTLSAYDNYNTNALSQLERTNINESAGAFSGLASPQIYNQPLMGTVVNDQTLGYNPYMS